MATTILRSQNSLRNRFDPRTSYSFNPNPTTKINHAPRRRRWKRSSSDGDRRSNRDNMSSSPPAKGLVMGQVKILKRGEELNPRMFFGGDDLELCSTDRLGPDPEVVRKQIRLPEVYAGTTSFVSSPPPSDLPFPVALVRSRVVGRNLTKLLKI